MADITKPTYTQSSNDYQYPNAIVTNLGLTLGPAGKYPLISKRIFDKEADAKAYINNVDDTAIVGLILTITGETGESASKNGAYFVKAIGSGNNEGVLERVGGGLSVSTAETADEGYLKTYIFSQNGVELDTRINIPKDFLVKSASIKKNSGEDAVEDSNIGEGHSYFEFIINTKDNDGSEEDSPIRVDLNELVEDFEAGTTDEIQLEFVETEDGKRELQATVVEIGAEKITTSAITASDTSVALSGTTLADQLNAIGIAIKEVEQKSTKISEYNGTDSILEYIGEDDEDGRDSGLAIKENASWDCGEW